MSNFKRIQPVNDVRWLHRDTITANDYNPNSVAPPELELLKLSIMEDGWTQPIVITEERTIVDGFHRWLVSGDQRVYSLTGGLVPTVTLVLSSRASRQISTVRHNRARGTHAVLKMADIIEAMIEIGVSLEEIMMRLQMEDEEVFRLANRKGIPKTKIIRDSQWSKAWVASKTND